MNLIEFTHAWDEAVQRAQNDRQVKTQMETAQLSQATGLHVRSALRAGEQVSPNKWTVDLT